MKIIKLIIYRRGKVYPHTKLYYNRQGGGLKLLTCSIQI